MKRRIKLKSQLYCKKQKTWNFYKGETEKKILNRWVFRDRLKELIELEELKSWAQLGSFENKFSQSL